MGNSSLENNQPDLQQTDISGWVAVTDAYQNHYKPYGLQMAKGGSV